MRRRWIAASFGMLGWACAGDLGAQTRAEAIRGRVTTDSGRVIPGADVIATMAPNRETFRTTTDTGGRYSIEVPNGTGDYLVYIAFPGRRAFRKRIMRSGRDSVFVVDAQLQREVASLAAVRTVAQRSRPPRSDDMPSLVGGLTSQVVGVHGSLSPDQAGDLLAAAATVPGVAVTPDGAISMFGVDASQNRVTLNGMTFDGGALPRDLPIRTRVYGSAYDPVIGGFGGALVTTEISPGQVFTLARGHLALDAPQLQAADGTARTLGQRYSQVLASYGRAGELSPDAWVYNAAVQGTRRSAPAPSLLRADAAALQRLGVATDSARRLLQLLGSAGIPTELGDIPSDNTTSSALVAFRLDRAHAATLGGLNIDTRPRFGVVGAAAYSSTAPTAASALAPPAHDGHRSSGMASVQLNQSRYFGKDASYLDETRSAFSVNVQRASPYLDLPAGSVLVASSLSDGSLGLSRLQFGGGAGTSESRSWRWETTNELSFSPLKAVSHRLKVYTQAQLEGFAQESAVTPGAFSYNSLADVQNNAPVSFERTLFVPDRHTAAASGTLAIADYWNKSPELQFVFGPRVEWNSFLNAPPANPAVQQAFGVRTDVTPGALHVSPRLGFTWLYPGVRVAGRSQGGYAMSSALGSIATPPRGVLRGGIGEFRSTLAPTLLAGPLGSTGLPGETMRRLSCVGPAVPVPDWHGYATNPSSVPAVCADGTGAAAFADAAPNIRLFDPAYDAARRWTANLTWASAYKSTFYTLDASYSLNVDQPGTVDLNFAGVERFTLPDESNRPVFVAASSIVPGTGLISPADGRRLSTFGRVLSQRSDLRSETKQATITLQPYLPQRLSSWIVGGSYTITGTRMLTRGFDGAGFGDPTVREWVSGFVPRHLIGASFGYRSPKLRASFTTYWRAQSGYPYTPLVASDINGDALANDRAFVFDPAHAPNASLASGMTALLGATTAEARRCLQRQLGQAAGVNSCRRPWTLLMNARADWERRWGNNWNYVNVSLNFYNPLAGIDQLLHGSSGVRGWGVPSAPDPTLYFVRGFDAVSRRFSYEVNPRFGNTRPSVAALYNPFRVTLDVSFSLTPNVQKQQVKYYLRPTRSAPGKRPPADTILARVRNLGASPASPSGWVLANADSLLLSPEQVSVIQGALAQTRIAFDSTYRALAQHLAELPEIFDPEVVTRRILETNRAAFDTSKESATIRATLTPIQIRLLPPSLQRSIGAPR